MNIFKKFFKQDNKISYEKNLKAIKLARNKKTINDYFIDNKLGKIIRCENSGFEMTRILWSQKISKILEGDKNEKDLTDKLKTANSSYSFGNYYNALKVYNEIVTTKPEFYESLFYYMRCCERVLSVALLTQELKIDKMLKKKNYKINNPNKFKIRCKWCGRYTNYNAPDNSTFGFFSDENNCTFCRRMYNAPSLIWDSPDGRAYSYFRGSFFDNEFYNEFEQDYNPIPLRKKVDFSEN